MIRINCPHFKNFIIYNEILDYNFFRRIAYDINASKFKLPMTLKKNNFYIDINSYVFEQKFTLDIYTKHHDEKFSNNFAVFSFFVVEDNQKIVLTEDIAFSHIVYKGISIPLKWLIENEQQSLFEMEKDILKLAEFNFS